MTSVEWNPNVVWICMLLMANTVVHFSNKSLIPSVVLDILQMGDLRDLTGVIQCHSCQ